MSDIAISVEHLGKQYRIGKRERYRALRDVITDGVAAPFRRLASIGRHASNGVRIASNSEDSFWALKDVSFDVKPGEVVGIIGRNGAGKSTLLKILSRITEPSEGRVRVFGRVGSLLEVGTGFHPELSGRENIFLNGAILGMKRADIIRQFDAIVAFAEVEKFIETPVKHYSSGMYIRLAFAVAAHMEPNILIVDEVLAVGDAAFQEKCLGKMQDVSRAEGKTVLLVSHNMGSIESICQYGIYLDGGEIQFKGTATETVSHYLQTLAPRALSDDFTKCVRTGTGEAIVTKFRLVDDFGQPRTDFRMGEPLNMILDVRFSTPCNNPTIGVNIRTDTGILVADCRSAHSGYLTGQLAGLVTLHARIDPINLYPRTYIVEPWVTDSRVAEIYDWIRGAASFRVIPNPKALSGVLVDSHHGITYIPTSWTVDSMGA